MKTKLIKNIFYVDYVLFINKYVSIICLLFVVSCRNTTEKKQDGYYLDFDMFTMMPLTPINDTTGLVSFVHYKKLKYCDVLISKHHKKVLIDTIYHNKYMIHNDYILADYENLWVHQKIVCNTLPNYLIRYTFNLDSGYYKLYAVDTAFKNETFIRQRVKSFPVLTDTNNIGIINKIDSSEPLFFEKYTSKFIIARLNNKCYYQEYFIYEGNSRVDYTAPPPVYKYYDSSSHYFLFTYYADSSGNYIEIIR